MVSPFVEDIEAKEGSIMPSGGYRTGLRDLPLRVLDPAIPGVFCRVKVVYSGIKLRVRRTNQSR
jgi:hypothetical protein